MANVKPRGNALYQYKPLSSTTSIRVVRVEPSSGPLVCHLLEIALSTIPYMAVSYTWGDPHPERTAERGEIWEPLSDLSILCDGISMKIQRNLYDLLHQLRQDMILGPLWIDAICIDQQNLDERGAQVAIMGDIYDKAQEDDNTADAAALMSLFVAALREHDDDRVLTFNWDDPTLYDYIDHPVLTNEQWQSIFRIFDRSWYTRGWIFQEVALAQKCKVLCGTVKLSLDIIAGYATFLGRSGWLNSVEWKGSSVSPRARRNIFMILEPLLVALQHREGGIYSLNVQRMLAKKFGQLTTTQQVYAYLQDLIFSIESREFTEKRDKVFAALALAKTMARDEQHYLGDWIIPDYHMDVANVFENVCRLIKRNTGSLSFLARASKASTIGPLPSWVPDLSQPGTLKPLSRFHNEYNATRHWSFQPIESGGYIHLVPVPARTEPVDEPCNGLLPVAIKVLEPVDCCRSKVFESGAHDAEMDEYATLFSILRLMPETSFTGRNWLETLWRTLTANSEEDETDLQKLGKSFCAFLKFRLAELYILFVSPVLLSREQFWGYHGAYHSISASQPNSLTSTEEIEALAAQVAQIVQDKGVDSEELASICKEEWDASNMFTKHKENIGRRIVLTHSRVLALAPAETEFHDVVCFIKGAQVPFMLRQGSAPDRYILVGEVYMDGLMDGEMESLELEERNVFLE